MEFHGKGGAGVPKNQDQNMKELLNLLGPSNNAAAAPQPNLQVQAQPQAANPRAVEMQSAAAVQPKQQQTNAHSMQQAHIFRQRQLQQQRLQQQQALQAKQRAAAAAAAAPSTASQGVVNELEEILRANQSGPQAPPPQAPAQVQQQRRPVSAPSTNRSTASVVSGASSRQQQQQNPPTNRRMVPNQPRSAVTQEQVIVGHFCRHALSCLQKLTGDLDNSAELQTNLKSAIKRLWAEWVAGHISKTALLETVARIVRSSCPAAAGINVISEFRTWYHQQLNVQRTNRVGRGNPPAPSAGGSVRQAGSAPQQPGNQTPAGYQFARNPNVPQAQQQIALQQHAAHQAAIAAGMGSIGAAQAKASVIRQRQAVTAKQEKTVAAAAYGSKSISQKTVAAKTVPRTVNVTGANPTSAHAQQALVEQRAAAMAQLKYQQQQNLRQGRTAVRTKAVGAGVKNEQMLHAMGNAAAVGNVSMAGKRIADPGELSIAAQKKVRAGGKFQKSPSKAQKRIQGGVMAVPGVQMMPPMVRGIAMAGRVNPNAIPAANVARFAPGALQQAVRPGLIQPVAPADPKKPSKKTIDNDLNVVDSIVDIDNEQNALVGGSQIIHELNMHESEDFSSLLLDGRVVRMKIEKAMAKHGLTGPISKEVIELISHSCKERLSYVFENVAEVANSRIEPIESGGEFVSRDSKKDVRGMLDKMRQDEERSLAAAAKRRSSKWRKEEVERSAREAENNKTEGTKSDKAAQAEADKKKKAKAAVEKKKAADSLQRSALSGAISGITKKRKKKANLAPLKLGTAGKSVSGKTASNAASLTPVATPIAAATSNPATNTITSTPTGHGIANKAGDKTNGTNTGTGKKTIAATRTAIKLEDCLAFFGAEPNMRQSALVYKWFTRLHAPPRGKLRAAHSIQ